MLKIIDLKVGNIGSVIKAVEYLSIEYELIADPSKLENATKILLPGVGSFHTASDRLFSTGFFDAITEAVIEREVPILGICVGMQLLARYGTEGGRSRGLAFIDAEVKKLNNFNKTLVVPHMGWNDISTTSFKVFNGLARGSCFYFVHSYAMRLNETKDLEIAYTDYGEPIVAYVSKGNIHGAQFHPEKSQGVGLQFLRNFIELC